MGPGHQDYITPLAKRLISQADVLVGWSRHLSAYHEFHGEKLAIGSDLTQMALWLQNNADRNIVVLASGEPMLYGIGKRLIQDLPRENSISCRALAQYSICSRASPWI